MSDTIEEQKCAAPRCHRTATIGIWEESPTRSDCWLMFALCDHHLEVWKNTPQNLDYEIVALEDLVP